ncbi:MAG: hypothetical protein O3C43_05625 [Verrucomicrobia bacterium]|nr:hypothetical protein [Verrucomicrobiota bacterium]MDA1065963.1 hypothetical protein [Verrucomicrobiota bacterium]
MVKLIKLVRSIYLIFFILSGQVVSTQAAESFTSEQKETLAAGEIVFLEPEGSYLFKAAIQIDAPAASVWAVMQDQDRIPGYVKSVKEIRIIESGDQWKIIEQKLKLHPLLPRFNYVFKEQYGPGYSIRFERVSGSFKEVKGWWRIDQNESGKSVTLVYSTYVDIGWFIPQSWIKKGINKDVPELLVAFRNEVYSDLEKKEKPESEL